MTAILLTIALFAPSSQPAAAAVKDANGWKDGKLHAGAAFTVKDTKGFDEVFAKAKDFAGKTVKVSGTVKSVCKKKGCWMVLAGAKAASRARITFKDYGFFVPKDMPAGTMATVEGTVKVKTLSEAERKHLAGDAGKKVEEIPAVEMRLVATAVELKKVGH